MKILVALDNWGLIGGSERYAGEVVASLAARGHDIVVLCGAQRTPALALPRGAELWIDATYSDPEAAPRELDQLAAGVRQRAPDVTLVLSCFQGRTFAALTAAGPLVRFVQDHTLFCPSLNKILANGANCARPLGSVCLERYFLSSGCSCFRQEGRVKPWIEGLGEFKKKYFEFESAKRARHLIVASHYMKSELLQAGEADNHVSVIPYFTRSNSPAIAPAALPAATQSFLDADAAPLVFTPARLALPDKGLDLFLAALTRIQVPFRALIAGDGPARAWLEAKARADGLGDRLHFSGWLSAGQIETLYAKSRVVVVPSTWKEPFGLVGIEAMAHGKPTVAFDVGGISEWLQQERSGLLLARGDVPAMAMAIEGLCMDAGLATRMGAAGRERVRRDFSEAAHLDALEAQLARATG